MIQFYFVMAINNSCAPLRDISREIYGGISEPSLFLPHTHALKQPTGERMKRSRVIYEHKNDSMNRERVFLLGLDKLEDFYVCQCIYRLFATSFRAAVEIGIQSFLFILKQILYNLNQLITISYYIAYGIIDDTHQF